MDKKIKKLWVKALLSGKYEQAYAELWDGKGYCCLGVLRKVASTHGNSRGWLGERELLITGLTDMEQGALSDVNDDGVPFDMIAGLIDEAL